MTPKTKATAVKMAREKALGGLEETGSCAYGTVRALQDTFDLQDEPLLKAASALTGGIGGRAETCGAMIGAVMMLGSVCGMGRNDGDNGLTKLYESMYQAGDFFIWFKAQNGCITCSEILTQNAGGVHYDFTDREQVIAAVEAGVLEKCKGLAQIIAGKAAEILWDELHKVKKHA